MQHEDTIRKVWKAGRKLEQLMLALAGLLGAIVLLALMPVWFFDLLTLGTMRPLVVAWVRDVLTLQYSLPEVWAALPQHWPAFWDHIVFCWGALGLLAVAGVGFGLMLLPLVVLCAQQTDKP